jgi:glutaredoxin-like YruB-family protein
MSEENTTQKEVVIYSTPTCHFCVLAKDFFDQNNIEYTNYDVQADPAKGQEMVQRSGQMGVPVIFIGEEMIIGFDEARIRELLGM